MKYICSTRFLKLFAVILLVITICSACYSGCYPKWVLDYGRGDWTLILINGYQINRINGHTIVLEYKENLDDISSHTVLENYYVKSYQIYDEYIFLEGIRTKEDRISDNELENNDLAYYVVNTLNHDVAGPFESLGELKIMCDNNSLKLQEEWIPAKDKPGDGLRKTGDAKTGDGLRES